MLCVLGRVSLASPIVCHQKRTGSGADESGPLGADARTSSIGDEGRPSCHEAIDNTRRTRCFWEERREQSPATKKGRGRNGGTPRGQHDLLLFLRVASSVVRGGAVLAPRFFSQEAEGHLPRRFRRSRVLPFRPHEGAGAQDSVAKDRSSCQRCDRHMHVPSAGNSRLRQGCSGPPACLTQALGDHD